ncbi:MAG: class 1 fructose-bisphosphatase [Gemmatimonadetes bacterium]|nr:class 1 fructose-bisphosphatase [Gemmatimonadota bacterium]
MSGSSIVTIDKFIIEQQQMFEGATGALTNLLYDIALAAKIISGHVRRAGLTDIMGSVGQINVQGEDQQKLDVIANETIKNAVAHTGRVSVLASEEEEYPVTTNLGSGKGSYVLLFDPLDGSSNIDVNVSIGTIFSIYRTINKDCAGLTDCLQRGREQVAAGYVMYGSSTVMVYTTGHGVHGFTLDPSIGEFLLMNSDIKTPLSGKYYSVNESNFTRWSEGYRQTVLCFKGAGGEDNMRKNARYIGSLVADFHRNLLTGGVFMYPRDNKSPNGKLRLLYEANPLAFIVEQAGGAAHDGLNPILDIEPTELHQRTPLIIGSSEDVEFVRRKVAEVESAQ